MSRTFIFGHKNPDTDTITSSLVMEDFEKKMGNDDATACMLGNPNKETQYVLDYLGIEPPRLLERVPNDAKVILVDHNSPKESVDNVENARILKVIDHHKVSFETSYPLYYRAEPVGCTETIMYKMYKEHGLEIDKKIAILMLSAIISDTLMLKSPTCTNEDIAVVKELAKIADINYRDYGMKMLKAGTDLSDFSVEQLIKLDAKEVDLKDVKSVIAQVNTASIPDVLKMKADLEKAMRDTISNKNLDLFVLLITDIINSNSQVIALGDRAEIVEKSYSVKLKDNTALLEGVVSRKKQVVPVLTENV